MAVKAEDRIKVKGYAYEKAALTEFIEKSADQFSDHVKNAVKQRVRTIEKEMKILGAGGKTAQVWR